MCPFCLASVGLIVAGATSGGGLAAMAVKLSRKKADAVPGMTDFRMLGRNVQEIISDPSERSGQDANPNGR